MSGLYNMVFGVSPYAPLMMSLLDLQLEDVPRFRDAFWNGEFICVYTRAGGPNRSDYEEELEKLRKHPSYANDKDDGYDSTYATFHFRVPSEFEHNEKLQEVLPNIKEKNREDMWKDMLEKLGERR